MKKALFLSVAKTLYKKSEMDLADDLKDAVEGDEVNDDKAEAILKSLDAEKVTTFKTEATERFNNGVKKGQKDTATKFEKKLKQVFNVTDDLEGDELLTHIETNLPEPGKPGDSVDLSKVTEEDLAKIPAFILKERSYKQQLKDKETEKETAIRLEQEKQTTAQIMSDASSKALAILEGKNPILPKDSTKASTMKNKLLIDELKGQKFMKGTDGSLIPLDAEGKQLNDAHGNPLDFNTLVEGIVDRNFEFNLVDPRKTPGNKTGNQHQQQSKEYSGKKPANSTEYLELLTDPNMDTDQKVALKETYGEQFSD